jgi:hypothetical protein
MGVFFSSFLFEHLVRGKYILSAKRRGYTSQNYDAHEGFTTAIAVGPQLNSENIVFRLLPAAAIKGQVVAYSGETVRRAQVILFAEEHVDGRVSIRRRGDTQTNDQGRYQFGGLAKGRYYVAVSARAWYAQNVTAETMAGRTAPDPNVPLSRFGQVEEQNASLDVVYPLTFFQGTTDSARASVIGLEPGATATADFSLPAVPALHLRLTAPGLDLSKPINVSIAQFAFGQPVFVNTMQAWRDADSIGIAGVPPGEIRINAQGNGEGNPPVLFNESLTATQGMEINLNQRPRGVPIVGIATAGNGEHLPERMTLILRDPVTESSGQAVIKADGSFDFYDFLVPGHYVLSLQGDQNWYVGSVQADGAQASGRVLNLQTANSVRLKVEISEGLGQVNGVAVREDKGVGGVMIVLVSKSLPNGANVAGRDQSDSDGTFGIANVPPGEYAVVAVENGWDQWNDPSVLQRWMNRGTLIRVSPNATSNVRVNIQ